MNAGARWLRDSGHLALGLNVFGHNPGAGRSTTSSGYRVTVDYRALDVPDAELTVRVRSTSTPTSARRSPTTRDCSPSSPPPTSPAASTPARRRPCGPSAPRRPGSASSSAPRSPTATGRNFGRVALDLAPRRAARPGGRAGRRPARIAARRARACATSSRTVRCTTGSSTTRPGGTRCSSGSGELAVLGFPGSRLLDSGHGGRPGDVRRGVPGPRIRRGRLVDRATSPGALLDDGDGIAAQAVALAPGVASLCVHGDSPGAVAHARAVRRGARGRGVRRRAVPRLTRCLLHRQPAIPVDETASFCGGRGDALWTTRRVREIVREMSLQPLARGAPSGIELSLPAHRLRGVGVEKQEDPDRELARGAGRWRQAGSEGFSGDRAPPRDQPRGSWCSYHREPLTYFPRLLRAAR